MTGDGGGRARRAGAALAAVLLLVACSEQSKIDPDAAVAIRGTALAAGGGPLSDRPVRLGTAPTADEIGLGMLTVGLSCIGIGCSGDSFDTTTGADGSYRFDLTGRDVQSAFGRASSVVVSTSAEPSGGWATGPSTSAHLKVQSEDLAMPDLALADVMPQLIDDGSQIIVTWDASAAAAPYTLTLLAADGSLVWELATSEGEATFDGRILEDLAGVATVASTTTDAVEGSDVTLVARSSGVAFHGGFGPPHSRGAPCEVLAEGGQKVALPDCHLTDGSLRPASVPSSVCPRTDSTETTAASCLPAARVRVTMPEPTPANSIVVRGCADPCRVEMTAIDGQVHDLGPVSAPFGTLALDMMIAATSVDVVTSDVTRLAEVSVWGAPPKESMPLLTVSEPTSVLDVGGGEGRDRSVAVTTGVVVLLVAVLLLGAALARRRSAPA